MERHQSRRRSFLQNAAVALTLPSVSKEVLAQIALNRRVEWKNFRTTTQYDILLSTIAKMKANANGNDPASWTYWVNIHLNRCPHGVPYFLAWHRGYLYYFEKQLRVLSGAPNLVLPYWDYYSYSTLPSEFTDTSSPLYVPRVNVNVRQALTLAPFSANLTNFPEGSTNAFEPSLETAPHNQLHNIVGNVMSTMQSPIDPVFWLHHANIDRLWVAWVAAGGGRKMAALKTSYWSGSYVYTSALSMQRKLTYDTRTQLMYYYQNESFPTSIPIAQASTKPEFLKVQASAKGSEKSVPPVGSFRFSNPRQIDDTTFAVGGVLNMGMGRNSVSGQIPVSSVHWQAMKEILGGRPSKVPGSARLYKSVRITLDTVEISEAGMNGGYYYQVYLNFPASTQQPNGSQIFLGSLGPFEINVAAHHGAVQLRYPVNVDSSMLSSLRSGLVTVSFVRIDGDNSPNGPAIGIGETRLELSSD